MNTVRDVITIYDLWRLMRRVKLDFFTRVYIKPGIYGNLAV